MYVLETDEETLKDWPLLSGLVVDQEDEEQQEEPDTSILPLVARSGNLAFLSQAQEGAR